MICYLKVDSSGLRLVIEAEKGTEWLVDSVYRKCLLNLYVINYFSQLLNCSITG